MSESRMRTKIIGWLKPWHGFAVENPALPGTPDISYIGSHSPWIELKQIPKWPADANAFVRVPHFTKRQRAWHRMHHRRGGVSWFLLQCKREFILLPGEQAALHVGTLTREQLIDLATEYWDRGLTEERLLKCICT